MDKLYSININKCNYDLIKQTEADATTKVYYYMNIYKDDTCGNMQQLTDGKNKLYNEKGSLNDVKL